MAYYFFLQLLLVALISNAAATETPPPSSPNAVALPPSLFSKPTAKPSPPPPPSLTGHNQQMNNIIDALIGAGDFAGWANLLSTTDPFSLPVAATLFVPSNAAIFHFSTTNTSFDPLLIPYHIVPQRLLFSDLRRLKTNTRLTTLLPSKYIVITNNSASNFTLDGSQITHPDIFLNSAFAVQGIKDILDYNVYNVDVNANSSPPSNNTTVIEKPKQKPRRPRLPPLFPWHPDEENRRSETSVAAKRCSGAFTTIVVLVAQFWWFSFIQQLSC